MWSILRQINFISYHKNKIIIRKTSGRLALTIWFESVAPSTGDLSKYLSGRKGSREEKRRKEDEEDTGKEDEELPANHESRLRSLDQTVFWKHFTDINALVVVAITVFLYAFFN